MKTATHHKKNKKYKTRHSNFDKYVGRIVITDMDDIRELADQIHGKRKT